MSHILVVDDMALCREPIAEALRLHGDQVTCAADGTAALESMKENIPDLVLLDVTMPEPDGLTVLRIMRRNPDLQHIPVVLLTDRSEREMVAQAAKCGVQGYLLKASFSLERLLMRVDECLGRTQPTTGGASRASPSTPAIKVPAASHLTSGVVATAHRVEDRSTRRSAGHPSDAGYNDDRLQSLEDLAPIMTRAELTTLVNDGLKLRPLAATVHNVTAITSNAACCATDVARAVAQDQALCIRILKLANSSAYSRGRPADGIQAAVQRIGTQEVRKLVMTLGVLEQHVGSESSSLDSLLFWEHSIACGLVAAALARECHFKAPDDCFLWGTVHDVGRLILLEQIGEKYDQVCRIADELGIPIETVERKLLLLDHCAVLKQALEHWQFPHAFIAPVVSHHQSVRRLQRLGPDHMQAAMIVALANRIAHALLLGSSGNEVVYPFDDLMEALGLSASVIDRVAADIPNETRDLKCTMLVHSVGDSWPDFGARVCERIDTTIRPLYVSCEPSTDALYLFLQRIGEFDGIESPNLGFMYLRDAREAPALFSAYEEREGKAGCGALPLIIVCHKGVSGLADAGWSVRPHRVLQTPVPMALLLRQIQALLAA